MTRDPDWTALPPATPKQLKRLLVHCTRKEPHERLHDIADVRLELAEGVADPAAWHVEEIPAAAGRRRSAMVGWLAAAFMSVVAAALLWSGG